MKQKPSSRRRRGSTKSILCLPDLEHAKAAVLNSLTSADAQRGYRHAIDEFVDWYCSEPRLAFNRTVVLRYRSHRLALRNDEDLLVDVLRGWLREPPRGREDIVFPNARGGRLSADGAQYLQGGVDTSSIALLEWNENGTLPSRRPRLEVPEESVSVSKLCRVVGEETPRTTMGSKGDSA